MNYYLWLCDKCLSSFRNSDMIVKILNHLRPVRECEGCHKEKVCQPCKITDNKEE